MAGSRAAILRALPDATIKRPLWTFLWSDAKAVLHERRRRFGIDEERINPADLEEDGDA
ncbi:hypothetical protein [Streptomyces viridochromogenes]|uniref:hypothetical protein n=1 Tax=Streptomyces viridochromogenes TaxID=1938 RepID=UPI000AC2F704|nr:hypothetical protein [Streptomyces viridochromogenes]